MCKCVHGTPPPPVENNTFSFQQMETPLEFDPQPPSHSAPGTSGPLSAAGPGPRHVRPRGGVWLRCIGTTVGALSCFCFLLRVPVFLFSYCLRVLFSGAATWGFGAVGPTWDFWSAQESGADFGGVSTTTLTTLKPLPGYYPQVVCWVVL